MKCERCYNRNFLVECKCGCGSIFGERDLDSRPRMFVLGHHSRLERYKHRLAPQRENHYNWKGGRWLGKKGYIFITTGHQKSKREHIIIMEKHIGRLLKSGEVVHHINGIKSDNRLENLQLLTRREHILLHKFSFC